MFYGNCITESEIPYKELSLEESLDLLYKVEDATFIAEQYLDEDEVLTEGANIEITKKLREFKKNFNNYLKAGKKALRKYDKKEAADNFAKARQELKAFKKEVEHMDSTVGSAVFGTIAAMLIIMAKSVLISLLPLGIMGAGYKIYGLAVKNPIYSVAFGASAKFLGVIYTLSNSLSELIVSLVTIVKRSKKGDKTEDLSNLYRTELLKYIDKLSANLSNLEKEVRKCKDLKKVYDDVRESKKNKNKDK